jgi:hypothetical protein
VGTLLNVSIGGIRTLGCPEIVASFYRFLEFYLLKRFGEINSSVGGAVCVVLVLCVPYGIIGSGGSVPSASRGDGSDSSDY